MNSLKIIGAGEAGTRAALHLRETGWDGEVTLIGQEPYIPYERPPLSKTLLTKGIIPPALVSKEKLEELCINFSNNTLVNEIDRPSRCLILENDVVLPYQNLLIATGASARKLTCPGSEHALVLSNLEDSLVLRSLLIPKKHLILIGAGFIGLELAAGARMDGCRVTVLEAASRVLGRAVPAEVTEVIANEHQQQGVEIICNVQLEQIHLLGDGYVVQLAEDKSIQGDFVVAGIGAIPEIALAEAAGLQTENGILVDSFMQTSDPNIYAAGDCCSFPHPLYGRQRMRLEMWRCAREQAKCAVQNMIDTPQEFSTVPWFWSDQFELGLQVVGLPQFAEQIISRVRADGVTIYFGLSDGGQLVSAAGVGVGNSVAKDIRLAEILITSRKPLNPEDLANPNLNLKKLLKN